MNVQVLAPEIYVDSCGMKSEAAEKVPENEK